MGETIVRGSALRSGQAVEQKSFRSGRYYFLPNFVATSASAALIVGTMRTCPYWVPNDCTFSRVGAEITVIGDVGSKLRLGSYSDDGNGRPGVLDFDAGQIAGDVLGVQEIVVSAAMNRGVHHSAAVVQAVAVTQPTVRIVSAQGIVPVDFGTSTPTPNNVVVGAAQSGVNGALPDPAVATGNSGAHPRIFAKVA